MNDFTEEITPRMKRKRELRRKAYQLLYKLEALKNLRFDQFCDSIRELFGDIKNADLKAIYRKISTNPDARVDWSELFGYFQSSAEEKEESAVGEEVSVFTVSKRRRVGEAAGDKKRRDTIQCLRYMPSQDCYISASQKGALTIWDSQLRLQSCVDINEPAWVTGCDYLPGIRRGACCTERSIVIWDNRTKGKAQHVFSIKPFEDSPQCMVHIPQHALSLEDVILFGDDMGYVNLLKIVAKDLNMKNSKGADKKQNVAISQNYPIEVENLTHPIVRRKLHRDWVVMVKYFPELRCFASCSPHSRDSFVLEEIDRLYDEGEVRGVSIHKGVNCFEYCAKANIIATGGVDKVIRVWHPHIFSRPTGKLIGHLFTIVDICCNERDQHLISLSTARVFRVWDIHTLTCLQVFTDNEERPGEKRIYSMVFDNKHERLLTGSSVLDSWPLTRAVQDTMQVPHTHDRPISQVLVNKELNQVVTVCTESIIRVWEIESGKRVHVIPEAHGSNIEVTAICLDKSGYRLASGALDGSIKVWDFGSGQEIKGRPGRTSDEDLSITGLMYTSIDGDRCILAAGWNNKIRLILDTNENYDLPVIRDFVDIYYWTREPSLAPTDPFKGEPLPDIGQNSQASLKIKRHFSNVSENNAQITNVFKKDYILNSHEVTCIDSLLPNTLITGAANGNIIVWDIDKSVIDKVFQLPQPDSNVSPGGTEQKPRQGQHKVNMIKTLIHRERKLDPAYIKRMNLESEREDRDETGSIMSVKATSHKVSRANSRASRMSNHPVQVDEHEQKELLDQLTARIEGTEEDQEKQDKKDKDEVKDGEDDDEEEKKDTEKSVDGHEGHVRFENEEEEVDEESKWIVETYDPILVSVHQDANIRFWDFEGTLLREISPVTRRQGTPVTAVCHDDDCNILITGDQKGYLTLWNVAKFLKNPKSEDMNSVKQMICWRAHLVKVISIVYVESTKSILSGSADGSVRVWWGTKGRFIGFFSQHRPFNYPVSEAKAGPAILPYDINEGPLAPVKAKNDSRASQKTQKYEYPLIFVNEKWKPFRRSAYVKEKETKRKHKPQPEDKKFFHALIKPRAYNHHLESLKAADRNQGAVFRALPVYRVRTPEKVAAPETSYSFQQDDESKSYLFGTSSKQKTAASDRRKSVYKPPGSVVTVSSATSLAVSKSGLQSATVTPSPRRR